MDNKELLKSEVKTSPPGDGLECRSETFPLNDMRLGYGPN